LNRNAFLRIVHKLCYTSIYVLVIISCTDKNLTKAINNIEKDSISIWIEQAANRSFSIEDRKLGLDKAFKFSKNISNDSIKIENISKIAYESEGLNYDDLFLKSNSSLLELSLKKENHLKIGEAHWNYGLFYTKIEKIDSSYYHYHKAFDSFNLIDNKLFMANMLYNMGFIQGRIKDYTGSEISLFSAIELYKELDRPKNLYHCYNSLGLIYVELEEFERAIYSHNTALDYLKKIESKGTYQELSLNNLGIIYQRQKKYDEAIENFRSALQNNNLKKYDIYSYARLKDNLAYTQFLKGDTLDLFKDLSYALSIRDSLNNYSGIVISKRHLSELYAFKSDTLKAVALAKEAFDLAKEVDNNRDKLETLLLLSKVDNENSTKYLNEYVHLNDSLQIEDRKTRNKFTRIRFETDEYIEETEKLSQQNIFISIGGITLLSFLALAYFLRVQRIKNKELLFEQEQQKANEEIFSLMLKQQSKLEEGRMKERHRISEDLHDGVLGKIFGTRLGLGFLNINGDENTIKKHQQYIDELQSIEKEIRSISHALKNEILSSTENYTKIIYDLIEQKSKLGNFKFNFKCERTIDWESMNDEIKINYYRIIQEGLQNIIKYAEASLVEVEIKLVNNVLNLKISDNGKGFKNGKLIKKGIGLKNIESRAKKLNGKFKINSLINKGTIIFVSNPL
jgi:signal transduction histidine kinase